MASYRKRGDVWQAIVTKGGHNKSASFATKALAVAWATKLESDILTSKVTGIAHKKTFGDLLERYRDNVSVTKKGAVFETRRINLLLRTSLAGVKLTELGPRHISAWRDDRLKAIQPESVRREWTILNSAINTAIREWEWLNVNPMKGVKRPEKGEARDRIATPEECEILAYSGGYTAGEHAETATSRSVAAFLFCCETGLRKGELINLDIRDINWSKRKITVNKGKTTAATRDVPLSTRAVAILTDLVGEYKEGPVLRLTESQVDALFRKVVKRCGIDDLHFHDSRHTAVTHLAGKLNVLDLARVIGHKDLKMLQVYYNKKAEDLVELLD